ncbi:MAG: hypothetical protein ACP5PB_06970 [Acidimicrobiales bacterium]
MRGGRGREQGGAAFRLFAWLVILAVVVAGAVFWYLRRASSVSVSNAISSCSLNLAVANPYDNGALRYVAVGTGATSAIAAVRSPGGWLACVVGDGVNASPIAPALLRPALSVIVTAADGSPAQALLILVHRSGATSRVVARSVSSRSTVIAAADGFEVLRLALSPWPRPRAGDPFALLHVGAITGYSAAGRATARLPLDWCARAALVRAGQACTSAGRAP